MTQVASHGSLRISYRRIHPALFISGEAPTTILNILVWPGGREFDISLDSGQGPRVFNDKGFTAGSSHKSTIKDFTSTVILHKDTLRVFNLNMDLIFGHNVNAELWDTSFVKEIQLAKTLPLSLYHSSQTIQQSLIAG